MKQKLAVSVLVFSALTFNRDLLQQLQVLLTRLSEVLATRIQPRTTIIYRSESPPPAISRLNLDMAFSAPTISHVTPARGPLGTVITIRGSGFTKTGNTIYASYGIISDLPSPDGETITFAVEPPGLPTNLGALKTATFPELRYRFYVKNANGQTLKPGEFILDL